MTTPVIIPKIGFAMQEATIVEWLVADGSTVKQGDCIYAMESDKSVQEVEAPEGGMIRILGQVGETYPVGTVVAHID
jgi:pyruvate/2-oxoglutarate dehydrogenase complex dihydrolipoamide acyltransferase (E2) component